MKLGGGESSWVKAESKAARTHQKHMKKTEQHPLEQILESRIAIIDEFGQPSIRP
jgi:hypothetical protein